MLYTNTLIYKTTIDYTNMRSDVDPKLREKMYEMLIEAVDREISSVFNVGNFDNVPIHVVYRNPYKIQYFV